MEAALFARLALWRSRSQCCKRRSKAITSPATKVPLRSTDSNRLLHFSVDIVEFASWLGMELPQEHGFLWIARQGLKARLPVNWKPCQTREGEIYYFNFDTGESCWEHPCDLFYRSSQDLYRQKKKQLLNQELRAAKLSAFDVPHTTMFPPKQIQPDGPRDPLDGGRVPSPTVRQGSSQIGNSSGLIIKSGGQVVKAFREQPWANEAEERSPKSVIKGGLESMSVPGRVSYKSMQTELLEKIKKELEDEGCNLMEQRRREVIDEVERQIEAERKRLQEMQNLKLREDLEMEQRTQEQKELERKRAWEAKLKQDEEEQTKMNKELENRRKRREEDLANVLELERKNFELDSLERLNAFRSALEEEELNQVNLQKEKTASTIDDRVRADEAVVLSEMTQEAAARMQMVASALESIIYNRELEVATQRVIEQADWERKELEMRIEREVEAEVASLKEQVIKEKRERMLQQVCRKISERRRLHHEVSASFTSREKGLSL